MSYRCEVCSQLCRSGEPLRRHTVLRPNGQIERELPVCVSCARQLAEGVRLDWLIEERKIRYTVPASPPSIAQPFAPGEEVAPSEVAVIAPPSPDPRALASEARRGLDWTRTPEGTYQAEAPLNGLCFVIEPETRGFSLYRNGERIQHRVPLSICQGYALTLLKRAAKVSVVKKS